MTLKQLLTLFGKIHWQQTSPSLSVEGVTSDSRQVTQNFVFVALKPWLDAINKFTSVIYKNS